jgi:hypothetical protein
VLIIGFGKSFHLCLETSWTTEDDVGVLEPIHWKFLSLDNGNNRSPIGRLFLKQGSIEAHQNERDIAFGLFRLIETCELERDAGVTTEGTSSPNQMLNLMKKRDRWKATPLGN